MSTSWKTIKNVQKAVKKLPPKKKKDKVKDDSPKLSAKEAFRAFVYDTLKNVFSLSVKEDGDINVTVDNLFPLMKSLELDTKDEAIIDMVHEACIETFGNIDILELDENVMNQRKRVRGEEFEQDIRSAFRMIDVDNDGFITVPDLYQLMMGIGEMLTDDELMELLVTADHDGDGMVDYKDFKYFLTGELTQEEVEEENPDEASEEQKREGEEENKGEEGEPKEDETEAEKEEEAKPEAPPEEEKPEELSKEEEEERTARELRKRKSLLWAFASQKKEEVKLEPEKPKEETKPTTKLEPVKEDEPTKDKDDVDGKDETGFITSVSVNIKEKEPEEEKESEQEKDKPEKDNKEVPPKRPMSALARRRLLLSMGSLDSGFNQSNDSEDGQSDSATDEGFTSRAQSAKSRRSNFPSRPSTAKSIFEDSIAETVDSTQDIDEEKSDKDEKEVECDFDDEMNERQKEFLENGIEQQIYCEVGVVRTEEVKDTFKKTIDDSSDDDSLDLESIIDDDPSTITPRINLTRLQSNPARGKPRLIRSKSAARLRTFRKIENVILCRQNTDPRLNIEHIRAANQRLRQEQVNSQQQKPNSNGMYCTHISIDLDVQTKEVPKTRALSASSRYRRYHPKPQATVSVQQTNSRKLLSRPQTAMTFNEAEKINYVSSKNFDLNFEKSKIDRDIKIIDLSKSVSIDTDRFEKPGLSNHHHGYKSVLPLGRVLSGYKNKINQGNGIMLNSISRKLERIGHLSQIAKARQSESQFFEGWRSSPMTNPAQKQAVITLELPDNIRQKSCRRYTQSNKNIHRPLVRT